VNPKGNGSGSIKFTLPASSVGTFPDIEPHFDSFPRLYDVVVTINTSGINDWEACLLLSGFQLPFLDAVKEERIDEIFKTDDPWAAIKSAKSREERIALFAAMQKSQAEQRAASQLAKEEQQE
jgi:hypothetical protein